MFGPVPGGLNVDDIPEPHRPCDSNMRSDVKALMYDCNAAPVVTDVPDPDLPDTGVLVEVGATGVCPH